MTIRIYATNKNKIKCLFCNWTTLNMYTRKDGKIRSGYEKLLSHVMIHHENKYEQIQTLLDLEGEINGHRRRKI